MKNFNSFIDIFNSELNEFNYIDNHKELENFHHFLQKYLKIAELMYPEEFHALLMASRQCPVTMEQIKDKVEPLKEKYKIEISPKGIILEKNNQKKKFPLLDIKDFIINYIYHKEDAIFYLILGWLLQEERFFNLQLFGVIMQIKTNEG